MHEYCIFGHFLNDSFDIYMYYYHLFKAETKCNGT